MPEKLADMLQRLSEILHWLGKLAESRALAALARMVRALYLDDIEDLETWVTKTVEMKPSSGAFFFYENGVPKIRKTDGSVEALNLVCAVCRGDTSEPCLACCVHDSATPCGKCGHVAF